jgi:hypothetical protein
MTTRLIITLGNSNSNGVDGDVASEPAGLPIAGVKIFRWHGDSTASTFHTVGAPESVDITNTTNFASHVPQCTFHCQMAKDLAAGAWGLAGDTIVMAHVGVNGSLLASFFASAASKRFRRMQAMVCGVRGLLGTDFKAYLGLVFGENERSDATFGPSIGADMATLHSEVKAWLGTAELPLFGTRLYLGLGTQNATIRTQQEAAFTTGEGVGYVNTDAFGATELDTTGAFGTADIHYLTPGQNIVGADFASILNALP